MPDFMRRGQDLDDLYAEVIGKKGFLWKGWVAVGGAGDRLGCRGHAYMASMVFCELRVQARGYMHTNHPAACTVLLTCHMCHS
jgi:hypothetical protein